jgi:ribosomal protein S18 acetylase RimI-like enzyme
MTRSSPAHHVVTRAIEVLRREGVRVFWIRLMAGLGVYRRIVLLERALDAPLPEPAPALPLEIRLLDESEVNDYLELRPDVDRSAVVTRLRAGQMCFVARHQGRVVSACWATSRSARTEFLACDLHFGEGEAYLFDAYTEARHRGQGLAPALCLHQLLYLQQAGFRRALRGTFDANTAALRAHAKSGFRPVGTLCRVKLGPWQRHYRRSWLEPRPSP